jgi:hypothetical protein
MNRHIISNFVVPESGRIYQALVTSCFSPPEWVYISPHSSVLAQTGRMLRYRILDLDGNILYESNGRRGSS